MSRSSGGPRFTWSVDDKKPTLAWISDDDFGYDAQMRLSGDFLPGHAAKFAAAVCRALNAAEIPVASDSPEYKS